MERFIISELLRWKDDSRRKPLILNGARQVGKTWILKHFGATYYKNVAYINCDEEPLAQNLFEDYNTERILRTMEVLTGQTIVAGETLIIIDEIQETPRGLHALKYFAENAPEQHIAVAGSLLGLMLHEGESFPVGKVNIIKMQPLCFDEFLYAVGENKLSDAIRNCDWDVVNALHTKLLQYLRLYMYVGGMPEAVQAYCDKQPLTAIRRIQQEILTAYMNDFSKHAPREQVMRISQVFESIPAQLAKENKKFIFGMIREGARAKDFEIAIQWLTDAGIVTKVNRVKKPSEPLSFYKQYDAFKLFLLDCGLLGAMNRTDAAITTLSSAVFEEYNGSMAEQLALQELNALSAVPVYYYTKANSQQEIDLLVEIRHLIVPIEVKAGENLQSKSLKQFIIENNTQLAIKTSLLPHKANDIIHNVPLYALRDYVALQTVTM